MPARKRPRKPLIERLQWLIYEFGELGIATQAIPPICCLMELAHRADPDASRAQHVPSVNNDGSASL